jgi:hypothetical protein
MTRKYVIKNAEGKIVDTYTSATPLTIEEITDKSVDLAKLGERSYYSQLIQNKFRSNLSGIPIIAVRSKEEYADRAFYLDPDFNWELKKDNANTLCLIPTKK